MKKIITGLLLATFMLASIAPAQAAGGFEGFLTGCCFGPRAVGDFNAEGIGDREFGWWFLAGCCFGPRAQIDYANGKLVHWREWGRAIPYAGIVFAIWDGIDGANGTTRSGLVEMYGSTYY